MLSVFHVLPSSPAVVPGLQRERKVMGAEQGIPLQAAPPAEGGRMTQCSQSVPPALYRLLCPLPSPVIISVCLLLSFLRVSFLSPNSASQPLLPSPQRLPTAEIISHGNGQRVHTSYHPVMLTQSLSSSQLRGLFWR